MVSGVDEHGLAIEAIATLVHLKMTMARLILDPAGVPESIYMPILKSKNTLTGHTLSKRHCAPLILEALGTEKNRAVRKILEIVSTWPDDRYHLADDEFQARATVLKAQEILKRGATEVEGAVHQPRAQRVDEDAEKSRRIRTQMLHLLNRFDELAVSNDVQRRGYELEGILTQLFGIQEIPVTGSFVRNGGSEQIDGAFLLDSRYYFLECRWRAAKAERGQVDSFATKVFRTNSSNLGLFLSINGWSHHVVQALKENREKSILLMDGMDLRYVLDSQIGLRDLLRAKTERLMLYTEPAFGAIDYLRNKNNQHG